MTSFTQRARAERSEGYENKASQTDADLVNVAQGSASGLGHLPTPHMLPPTLLGLLVVLLATPGLAAPSRDTYDESLLVQSLPDGKVHSSFSFTLGGPWHQEGLTMGSNARGEQVD